MSRFERKMISLLLSLTLVFCCFNLGALNVKAMEASDEVVADDIETSGELEADEQQPSEEVADVTEEVTTEGTLEEESADGEETETAEQTDDFEVEESDKGVLHDMGLAVGESWEVRVGEWWEEVDGEVSWSCDNTNVVRLETDGRYATIYALAVGSAKITARCKNGKEESCIVSVRGLDKSFGDFEYCDWADGTIGILKYKGNNDKVVVPSSIDGKNVTVICSGAFSNKDLHGSIINPNVTYVKIPKSVTTIAYAAFRCTALSSIEFESGSELKTIEEAAFYKTNLTQINLPNKLEYIGTEAFVGNNKIKEIVIPESVKEYGDCAFGNCEALERSEIKTTVIGPGMFYGCASLKNVSFQSGTKKISESAFAGCGSLEKIVWPNGINQIGESAFERCGLKEVSIPDSVTSVGSYAFAYNESLTKAVLSNNLTFVDDCCFIDCPIAELSIGGKTKKVGRYAFRDNKNIVSLNIPDSVTDLEYCSFANCTKLKNIKFSKELTNVQENVLEGTAWYNGQPNGVVYTGPVAYQYKGTASDNTNIVINNNTKGIASFAFYNQKGVTSVKLNAGLKTVNYGAFINCKLNSVIIPSSVTDIGKYAFGYDVCEDNKKCDGYIDFQNASEHFGTTLRLSKRNNFKIYGVPGSVAETYAKENGFKFVAAPTTADIYIHEMSKDIIIAGLVTDAKDKTNLEYSWYATQDGNTWETVSDWRVGHEWLDWTPDKFGDYVIVGKVRVKGEKEVLLQASTNVSFHPHIKGKCQMPYSGEQGVGYLIGVESYDNPGQKYQYEMLILDCTLLAQGLPAWTYTTGQFRVPEGNAGWCIWTPQYGYYWTLFRVYDENGVLIDEECFGFANIC